MLNTKEIIEEMKAYEIKSIEERYKGLSEKEVKEIFDMAENKEEVEFLKDNMDILTELVFGGLYMDRDILRVHVFINSSTDFEYNVGLEESSELTESILTEGLGICQSHVFYTDKNKLYEIAKKVLNDRLDDPEYVTKYFCKDEVVRLWVENRTKEDAINQLLLTDNVERLLELIPAVAFTTSKGTKIYYSYIDSIYF